jgi:lipopolysaccharide/colanic/teichoic acid biosynthesis glycosyltransferase
VGRYDPDAYFREHILPRKNELRVKYIKNWTLTEDLNILWCTFVRVVRRISNQ